MWTSLSRALAACVDLLLPPVCLLCGQFLTSRRAGVTVCRACRADMPPLGPARCPGCARPYPAATSNHRCGTCLTRPPAFSAVHAAGLYRGAAREAVHRLKFHDHLALAKPLGHLLGGAVLRDGNAFEPHCVVPVPLHPHRLRQRGYNQAMEIARPVARLLAVPVDARFLVRVRPTTPQQELSATARRRNLRNAFALASNPTGMRILLVDDVMTTGETVRECSRILRAGGAAEVQVAVFARA